MLAQMPAFWSATPRPQMAPSMTCAPKGSARSLPCQCRRQSSTATVSRCPASTSERPAEDAPAKPYTLGRPGATSAVRTSSQHPSESCSRPRRRIRPPPRSRWGSGWRRTRAPRAPRRRRPPQPPRPPRRPRCRRHPRWRSRRRPSSRLPRRRRGRSPERSPLVPPVQRLLHQRVPQRTQRQGDGTQERGSPPQRGGRQLGRCASRPSSSRATASTKTGLAPTPPPKMISAGSLMRHKCVTAYAMALAARPRA